jgi:hypothetical protein
VLLRCERGHCWQETLDLETLHSGVFVERRADLEEGVAPTYERDARLSGQEAPDQ